MVASHADVTSFGVGHAFLPDVGESVTSAREARKVVAEYAVYFLAVSSRTCQMSYMFDLFHC